MLVCVLMKFGSGWAIFYLFMTSNVHPFFTTFFADQPGPAHPLLYLITDLQIAITFQPLIRFI